MKNNIKLEKYMRFFVTFSPSSFIIKINIKIIHKLVKIGCFIWTLKVSHILRSSSNRKIFINLKLMPRETSVWCGAKSENIKKKDTIVINIFQFKEDFWSHLCRAKSPQITVWDKIIFTKSGLLNSQQDNFCPDFARF